MMPSCVILRGDDGFAQRIWLERHDDEIQEEISWILNFDSLKPLSAEFSFVDQLRSSTIDNCRSHPLFEQPDVATIITDIPLMR